MYILPCLLIVSTINWHSIKKTSKAYLDEASYRWHIAQGICRWYNFVFKLRNGSDHETSQSEKVAITPIQRLWVIWGQCYPRVAAAPSLPNGLITQLSPYFTRKPGTTTADSHNVTSSLRAKIRCEALHVFGSGRSGLFLNSPIAPKVVAAVPVVHYSR